MPIAVNQCRLVRRGRAAVTFLLATLVPLALAAVAMPAYAVDTNVAVAANFTEPAREIAQIFQSKTGHKAILSFGATGQLYAQITQGAPFQVFLSADDTTPKKLVGDGLAVAGSPITYAIGKIVLFSKDADLVKGEQTLKEAKFNKLAIANPATAPYGAAAVEAMKKLGVYDAIAPKLVQGSNISQTFQFVDTGNAELGFVALSQVVERPGGSRWIVPANLHAPIRQDTVLLKTGAENEAARAFIAFLKGPEATAIIEKFGYTAK
jgi:molybdate transport system substrate-binding protein